MGISNCWGTDVGFAALCKSFKELPALRALKATDNRGLNKMGDASVYALFEQWKLGYARRLETLDMSGVVLHNHDQTEAPWVEVFNAILEKKLRLDKLETLEPSFNHIGDEAIEKLCE